MVTTELVLLPEQAADEAVHKSMAASQLGIDESEITFIRIHKRSIDSRSHQARIRLLVEVYCKEPLPSSIFHLPSSINIYPNVSKKSHALIIGAGPAGLFAALRLIELGIKPVIIERG